jgi:hypothetical protein
MQKIGITILQKGKWNDKQVLSAQWIKTIFQPYISNAGDGDQIMAGFGGTKAMDQEGLF